MQGDKKERRATVLSFPNLFLEFTKTQIEQVLEHCACIASIDDVTTASYPDVSLSMKMYA